MRRFQISLHVRPTRLASTPLTLDGIETLTLVVDPARDQVPFAISFEEAYAALEALPRMFIEPDGSFVWVAKEAGAGGDPAARQQVDGLLFDRAGYLQYVELSGSCDSSALNTLLTCCGWPNMPVMMQLSREAVFLDEATFRARFMS